jgi:hypothetical protein
MTHAVVTHGVMRHRPIAHRRIPSHRGAGRFVVALALAAAFGAGLAACGKSEPPTQGGPATLRLLTEAQYRKVIADVFGSQIVVAGRFDPIVRTDGLLAVGAGRATVSASGIEHYSALARAIADQVVDPANRALLVPCVPESASAADSHCAAQFLGSAGRYLYRRPLDADELAKLVKIADIAAATRHDFYAGLGYGLRGMLESPDFLFISERTEPDPAHAGVARLDGFSRATRLSFFLWNTSPDEPLLAAAASGELATREGLERQADRLMASPRFQSGVRAFFTDMLGLDDFATLEKDTIIYPAFGLAAANDAREQVLKTLIDELIVRNGDYRDVFTTRRTFMTGALGLVYRVPVSLPAGWTPYEFPESDPRAGIQTSLSFVALHSHPGKSSPTLRGKAIRELLLCQKIPDPPSTVNFDRFNDPHSPLKTARARLQAHAVDPACAGCHKLMDPIGLALEQFDGAGQLRATENGEPIDTHGEINGRKFADARELGVALHQDPAAASCLVRRAYSYAASRTIERGERDWIAYLDARFAQDGYRVKDLMRRIATSEALYTIGAAPVMTAAATRQESDP